MFVSALGLAGYGLARSDAHAHADDHHRHVHEHHHGGHSHTHHHSHGEHEGHTPGPAGEDDHHCSVDHVQPDAVVLMHVPRDTRRANDVDRLSATVAKLVSNDCRAVAPRPPRAPPQEATGQDSLPQLRTIVLLT